MKTKRQGEKSPAAWILTFAGSHKRLYGISVLAAVLGVICSMVPYVIMGEMIRRLVAGERNWQTYLILGLWMALFWTGRVVFHSISTTCSHKATFHVLGEIRRQMCHKLSRVPLGYVKDMPSGSLKNIMMERTDSMETTLAHILPEFTANILAPVLVFAYMLAIDWRMALISLITLPLGLLCYSLMMVGYEENYRNVVEKTKVLNSTAVEYINGIEVIKAFGKAKSSYERFVRAAREGASCYVEWMRKCDIPFSLAMVLTPCTALTVLPAGGYFVMQGSLAPSDFMMLVLLSVGLIPENELSQQAGVEMSPLTQGAVVDDSLQTSKEGIFACGNVLHVHDLVDFVSAESFKAGKAAADYVQGKARKGAYVALKDGDGVRGVVPQRLLKPEGEAQSVQVMFRPAGVYENATLCVMDGDREILRQRKRILTPGEMAELTLKPEQIASLSGADVTVCVKQ